MSANKRFLLVRRPNGLPVKEDFSLVNGEIPVPGDGQIVVRNHYASLDPAIRGRMDDKPSYAEPIALGAVVGTSTVGVVVASRHGNFAEGQWVRCIGGIEDYSLVTPNMFTFAIDPDGVSSVTHYLSVLGPVGLTAYFGLLNVGKPKSGETILVSGAAGAVGSLVGQIAKIQGCRTVGIAGGAKKCQRLLDDYGYDAAIDYRNKDIAAIKAAIDAAAPQGVDVVFENIGGDILDAALLSINQGARIALCGLISEYNKVDGDRGCRNLWQLIVKCASIQGFLVRQYIDQFPQGAAVMAEWIRAGKLRVDEHIDEGIDNALPAFLRLFEGSNEGKMILKIA